MHEMIVHILLKTLKWDIHFISNVLFTVWLQ